MSSSPASHLSGRAQRQLPAYAQLLIFGAVLAAAALAAMVPWPAEAAAGWLGASTLMNFTGCGALLLVASQHLVRGRWRILEQPLTVTMVVIPVGVLCLFPALSNLGLLYPWVSGEARSNPFLHHWLTPSSFVVRSLLLPCLAGALAISLTWRGRSPPIAAATLILTPLVATLIGADWVQSRQPDYASSALGLQLLGAGTTTALAAAILVYFRSPKLGDDSLAGGLLLMLLLLWAYLKFMPFFIARSSNLPAGVGWYALREISPWNLVLWTESIAGGSSIALLLFSAIRRSRRALNVIAFATLCIMGLDVARFALPPNGTIALLVFASAVVGAAMIACAAAAFLAAHRAARQ